MPGWIQSLQHFVSLGPRQRLPDQEVAIWLWLRDFLHRSIIGWAERAAETKPRPINQQIYRRARPEETDQRRNQRANDDFGIPSKSKPAEPRRELWELFGGSQRQEQLELHLRSQPDSHPSKEQDRARKQAKDLGDHVKARSPEADDPLKLTRGQNQPFHVQPARLEYLREQANQPHHWRSVTIWPVHYKR